MAEGFPLCLDSSIRTFCGSNLNKHSDVITDLGKRGWTKNTKSKLLLKLSELLIDPELTLEISSRFRVLIPQLLHGAADLSRDSAELQCKFCVALCELVLVYPQCHSFTHSYLLNHTSFLCTGEAGEPAKKRLKKEPTGVSALTRSKACYTMLLAGPEKFRDVYDWSNLISYLNLPCLETKWYVIQALSIANRLSGKDKQLLLNQHFSVEKQAEMLSGQLQLEKDMKSYAHLQAPDAISYDSGGECVITADDLHAGLTLVSGIILPKISGITEQLEAEKGMVVVPSALAALQTMAIAVSSEEPVVLSGHIGAGKTCLVEYLAKVTNRHGQLIKVQLGEQIDSKTLLGSYCCTETPGQFVWRPGPLTTAVTKGQWLLLEDIDIAPMDVISSLLSLIETGVLPSNQGHNTKAAAGFQLFMTKRLHATGLRGAHTTCSLLEKSVMTVTVEPLSRSELSTIIQALYPNLTQVIDRLLDMYLTLSAGKHMDDRPDAADKEMVWWTSFYGNRKLSTRDLLRWCNRISRDFELKSADNEILVFQEALDCFCDSLGNPINRIKLAEAIGTKINVTAEKANYYCNVYKPTIDISNDLIKVGRASLDRKPMNAADSLNRDSQGRFAFTRQSSALLEKICVCVKHKEPVLLVGETGTGKTSVVQYLAAHTGRSLTVINMNQQSDCADLLGGYKPITISRIISPLREQFEVLFCKTFSRKQNQAFLGHIQQCFADKRWSDLLKLVEHTVKAALGKTLELEAWGKLQERLATVKLQVKYASSALAFSFVEGALVKALTNGDWVLLDEINLATAETLDCLCGLLDSVHGSVTLVERGDAEPVYRHPEFRLFACMNPATDVGKKELTAGVRSRFTEFFVDELESKADLRVMVNAYLSGLSLSPKQTDGIVNFYLAIKKEALMKLTDGTGKRPTYSLRTLCRALRYAASNPYHSVQRSLYEAFCMSFLTQVDRSSHPSVTRLILQRILGKENAKAVLSKPLLPPVGVDCEKFEGFWLKKGSNKPIRDKDYILTETVKANMRDVARVVACGSHPVLLQGETSVGKTSMIEYIAQASGNRCVRINNHEHTDVQEYTGSYVADEHGHLVFKEGILVDAMRNGYWIILDELNLAPTDVLEALNRLLDDNRELFIAETQTTVKAHPSFILFATQNPPGLYGGRKMLSRAFRNRFVELHFDEIPNDELEHILHKRCAMPLSSSRKIIKVMSELQLRRRDSGLFAGKQGYITLRDVFRWGERYRQTAEKITDTFYDWDQLLAEQGFMLLAGRVRKAQEDQVIVDALEKHFKRRVNHLELFSLDSSYFDHYMQQAEDEKGMFKHIVWTYSLARLAVLVGEAMKYNEPVLMVGDTGCGKTTICQYFAHIYKRELYTVNCHMHTEGSHFLGGLRPVRHVEMEMDEDGKVGRLFEWQDGPLVSSMLSGSVLLVDEISLADDSVLERLNSVLEPSRTLVLAEKGGELEVIKADPNFRMVATMNPAGDYGKKELSPALRNRFTEIWCPQSRNLNDFKLIIAHNISTELKMLDCRGQVLEYSDAIVQFIDWFHNQTFGRRCTISVRDMLAWVGFINKSLSPVASFSCHDKAAEMYIHGACLVFLDALGSSNVSDSTAARKHCLEFLYSQVNLSSPTAEEKLVPLNVEGEQLSVGPFSIALGTDDRVLRQYTLDAPSTSHNCLRLVRGLQLDKPILLEGSPGVGKTSLVTALAKASGHHIARINLSQQTDIADLFGADLPVEGGVGGQFAWRDGLFLQALKLGHWVVLDELNLASQSVLEGLNACFDHRAEVFVPELCKTFHIQHEKVKIFACQNPLKQGGGRQGLPQSFLNRFTQVYIDEMDSEDQEFIAHSMYSEIPRSLLQQMVLINAQMVEQRLPGEYNLRDIFRWCELILKYQVKSGYSLAEHFSLLYVQPLRASAAQCEKAYKIFESVTGTQARHDINTMRIFHLTNDHLLIGNMLMRRSNKQSFNQSEACILHKQLSALESLATCMDMGWMAILDGPDCSGKSTIARILCDLIGEELKVFSMNSAMDTTDLLGGFAQVTS
ncbi:midasin-like [Watersipora subatra]|uniref:midasin-like n=1 Tax=Watersipora subatra TaxID=2589382 RepID=UPI00355C9A76